MFINIQWKKGVEVTVWSSFQVSLLKEINAGPKDADIIAYCNNNGGLAGLLTEQTKKVKNTSNNYNNIYFIFGP